MTVGALLLAAGSARRMGAPKLALPIDGIPIIARAAQALAAAGLPVLLVTGAHADAVRAAVPHLPHVFAPDHAQGLSASLRAGLAALPADWSAVLVALGDMPFVQPATCRALADCLAGGAEAVVPVHAGRIGNPAGFARARFPALAGLSGDAGARSLLGDATRVAVDDPGIHRDIDTPEDL
ncbi:MAG: nucleotidyltransferase family protein [Sphingomonadaceae bacterium]